MGINWGIALGQAAKSGVDTWERLQEERRRDEQAAREQEKFEWEKKNQEDERKLADLYGQTIGAGDTKQVTDNAAIQDPNSAYNQYQGEDGPATPTKAIAYSNEDKQKDFYQKAAAAGVNPMKVQQAALGNLQYSGALRTEKRAKAEDDLSSWHSNMVDVALKDGPLAAAKKMADEYNTGDAHKDGISATVVPSGKPGEYSLVRTHDKTGKVIDSTVISQDTVLKGIEGMAFQKYLALPGKFKEGIELKQGQTKADAALIEANAKKDLVPSQKKYYESNANYADAHADATRFDTGSKRDIQQTIKGYTDQIKALDPKDPEYDKKRYDLTQQAASAVGLKSGDFKSAAASTQYGRALEVFTKAQEAYAAGKTDVPPSFPRTLAQNGYAVPEATAAAKKEIDDLVKAGKTKEAQAAVKAYNTQFSNMRPLEMPTAPAKSDKPSALPTGRSSGKQEPSLSSEIKVIPSRGGSRYIVDDKTYMTRADAEKALEQRELKKQPAIKLDQNVVNSALKLN